MDLSSSSELSKLPNRLTMSRVFMIFIFVALANINTDNKIISISESTALTFHIIAYVIAILAGFTDFLDGWLARKFGWVSDFGALMDPLADKIFVVATFMMLVDYQYMPAWMAVVVISREFLVTGLRLLAVKKGKVISADKWGKVKTASQMLALLIAGASWVKIFDMRNGQIGSVPLWTLWYILMLFLVFITVASGVGYFIKNRELYSEIS